MLLVTLALSALLLAAVAGLRGVGSRLLADHYRQQIAGADEAQADSIVDRAAQLGEAGVSVLVEALASPEQGVARAGRRRLLDELSRWQSIPAADASSRIEILAHELCERADRFSPEIQPDVAAMATRILLWPLDESVANRGQVIACCQRVLKANGICPATHERIVSSSDQNPAPDEPSARRASGASRETEDPGLPLAGLSEPPTDNLSCRTTPPGLLPTGGLVARLTAARAELQADANDSDPEPPRVFAPGHDRAFQTPAPEQDAARQPGTRDVFRKLAYLNAPESPAAVTEANSAGDASRWQSVETLDVVQALQNADVSEAAAARDELRRRGFTPVHFEIARQLLDRDPTVRISLARRLPALTSINAVPWLLHLTKDADAGVRQAAIAILATTGDRDLLVRLERQAACDPAPVVQRMAAEIAKRLNPSLR